MPQYRSLLLTIALGFASLHADTAVSAAAAVSTPTQVMLWSEAPPDEQPAPGPDLGWTNIVRPTLTVFFPKGPNTGIAIAVFPGGGFEGLALKGEGTDICDWLIAKGITCVLLRYRVPSLPYDWHCKCRPDNLTTPTQALEDAQRALRLIRYRAADWHIDPHKIGVMGFSAGGYLVAEISTRYGRSLYAARDAADKLSARPDFAVAVYPGHLTQHDSFKLNPNVPVDSHTPPTFLVQAENDDVDNVEESLVYYMALKNAGVPAEMHLYAQGGHAFGLKPSPLPISQWPALVERWLGSLGMFGH